MLQGGGQTVPEPRGQLGLGGLGGFGFSNTAGFVQSRAIEDDTEQPRRFDLSPPNTRPGTPRGNQIVSPLTNLLQNVQVSWLTGALNASMRQQEGYQQELANYELNRTQDTQRLQHAAQWVPNEGSLVMQHMQNIKENVNRDVLAERVRLVSSEVEAQQQCQQLQNELAKQCTEEVERQRRIEALMQAGREITDFRDSMVTD
eukprot:843226-Amphidinium_carterae.1